MTNHTSAESMPSVTHGSTPVVGPSAWIRPDFPTPGAFLGFLAALLLAGSYVWWWLRNDGQPNAVTICLAMAIASLITVHIFLALTKLASVRLLAAGLWIFLTVSLGGLVAAAVLNQTQALVVNALNLRMVLTGAGVALYAVGILGVRYWWIILPMSEMARASVQFPELPLAKDSNTEVSLLTDGYFVTEDLKAQSTWITSIKNRAQGTAADEWMLARAHVAADEQGGLKASGEAIAAAFSGNKGWEMTGAEKRTLRQHALVVALNAPDTASANNIFLMKVQNQLCVFAMILLAATAAFSSLGWTAPMGVAAIAAVVFRMRDLTPMGKPGSYDGGARWMALFMTPLTGAVSAVLGLIVLSALAHAGIFSTKLATDLELPSKIELTVLSFEFTPLMLGLAVAFGWSAKLLDSMLKTLTETVEQKGDDKADKGDDDKAAKGTVPPGTTAPPET
ncbi:MAG: hypothetical protein Q4P23_16180, partial [Micrococcaceae bacterium]|nr:hypothetical protein [Micrococcaceae bacterium]